jgi:hypothetical protein
MEGVTFRSTECPLSGPIYLVPVFMGGFAVNVKEDSVFCKIKKEEQASRQNPN